MKKYIFFIRAFNDWDNIAPIIYYLAKNEDSEIFICFYRIDLRDTHIFKYLEKNIGDKFQVFFWKSNKLTIAMDFAKKIFNKIFSLLKLGIKLKQNIYVPEKILVNWIEQMNLEDCKKVIVVFDRILDPFVKKFQIKLKHLNCIFISCPHGPYTNVNEMTYKHKMERMQKNKFLLEYFKIFDYMIFADNLRLNSNEKFHLQTHEKIKIDFSRLPVLGSIRYCSEWMKHVDNFNPKLIKDNQNKIKVIFFMKKFTHNVFSDEVYRTLDLFESYPDIDFYIVPHTRGMSFSLKNSTSNIHIDNHSTSTSLINMADVILFYGGTSIVIEPMVKKKLIACIDYLDCNRNVFEYYNACHVLKCRDDLCFFLELVLKNKINFIDGGSLLNKIVYAGDCSKSVSEKYVNFFKNL